MVTDLAGILFTAAEERLNHKSTYIYFVKGIEEEEKKDGLYHVQHSKSELLILGKGG